MVLTLLQELKMKKSLIFKIFYSVCIFQLLATRVVFADQQSHYILLLKEMFTKVTIEKNDKAIPVYYDKGFQLYSNGKIINFNQFLQQHHAIYQTPIQYKIRYDENTFIEKENKVAGRLFITTKKPNELAQEIEVILVAEYKDNKLYRLWELTYPDWAKMKAFKKIKE